MRKWVSQFVGQGLAPAVVHGIRDAVGASPNPTIIPIYDFALVR